MSGKSSRDKGQRGEREVCKMLRGELGLESLSRDLSQTRAGGCDISELKGWSIEVKYQETLHINAWWQQCLDQCKNTKPLLIYRKSRQPWKCIMLLSDVNENYKGSDTVEMGFLTACTIIRENM
jgi:hypothetical protein